MKKVLFYSLFVVAIAGAALSCGDKKHSHGEEAAAASQASASDEDWTMMDEFHLAMAEAFHPYKDSANLQPAKDHAAHMVAVAERWAESELPARVNNEDVKKKIDQLRDEVRAFEQKVKTESDDVVGAALNDLHDRFHELQDAWYHSGESGHQH